MEHYLSFVEKVNESTKERIEEEKTNDVINIIKSDEYMALDNFERGFYANLRSPTICKIVQYFCFQSIY